MSRQPCLIVLTVGIFFEPLVTVSKLTFKADNMAAPTTTEYQFQTVDIVTKIEHKLSYKHPHPLFKSTSAVHNIWSWFKSTQFLTQEFQNSTHFFQSRTNFPNSKKKPFVMHSIGTLKVQKKFKRRVKVWVTRSPKVWCSCEKLGKRASFLFQLRGSKSAKTTTTSF